MRGQAAILLSLLLLAGAFAPIAVGTSGSDAPASVTQQNSYLAQEQPAADNTVTRIDVQTNGTATWTIQFRTQLATDEDEREYNRFQESFRNDTSRYLDPFRERMTGVVGNADEATDREMRATSFHAETTVQEVPRRWGIVRYEFTWVGFADTEGDRLLIGDVFAGGFYIGEDDVLEIAVPDGYAVTEAEPAPDEQSEGVVTWFGREDFADSQPRLVAEPTDVTGPETPPDEDALGGVVPFVLLGFVVVAVLVVIVLARRRGLIAKGGAALDSRRTADAGDDTTAEPTAGDSAATAADDTPEAALGAELMADEDRVVALLREQGGRIKQGDVAESLDWSKSKTSRVLSRMAESDQIRKFQLGRENVIELPDDE